MGVTAVAFWNKHGGKDEETKKYDEQHKETFMAKIRKEQRPEQMYRDLDVALKDAELMYNFMEKELCRDVSDISIMSTMVNYNRLVKKDE